LLDRKTHDGKATLLLLVETPRESTTSNAEEEERGERTRERSKLGPAVGFEPTQVTKQAPWFVRFLPGERRRKEKRQHTNPVVKYICQLG
jgi:hypothetical protein